jgi:hypothetical protein
MAPACRQQLVLGQTMELGLQEDEGKSLVEQSKLLFGAQGSLSLSLGSVSHREAHSSLPIKTKLHSS